MPNVITGSSYYQNVSQLKNFNYEYDYGEFDFRPGKSKLHDKIVSTVMERARAAYGVVSNRFSSWRDIDKLLTTYVRPSAEDVEVKENDPTKPTTIIFPYSYAVLETLLTYLSAAFFQDPIFRYEGSSPEDTLGAIMLELVVQKHCQKNKVALALHTMFRDAMAYGVGVVAPTWEVRRGRRNVLRKSGKLDIFGRLFGREPVEEEEVVLFEGNALYNIDPYCVLPDPGVSVNRLQDAEFFGWVENTTFVGILRREQMDENYFNGQYLRHLLNLRVDFGSDNSGRSEKTKVSQNALAHETKQCQVVHMYMDLIPYEWELGDSTYPEKWLFSVAAGEVLIQARPLNLNHGMFPIAIAAPDFDGYSALPVSKLETQYGLQHTLNWLFNSHITNVRKAINDMLVVDPYMVNIKDLQTPEPGKLIRMRRPAWGRGVRDAVMQLAVNDVTRANIGDASWIINWMNNIVGVDESLMGSLRAGGPERLTKSEFLGTRQSSLTRLEHMAKVISMQAMQDIAYFFASHTQQLMSQETYVNTIGEWQKRLEQEYGLDVQRGRMKVTPSDLLIDYDVVCRDGSIPATRDVDMWLQVFTLIAEHPELNQRFDIVRIFDKIARAGGEKNVQEFYRVMPDEQVMQQAQAGNLVPTGGANGQVPQL
jgi:hypothetical protein